MNAAQSEMDRFLADVERQAWSMANVAVNNPDDALDIVQDTMLTLVRKYATRPAAQWRPLFFRILQNRIRDCHRRRQRHGRLFSLFNAFRRDDDSPDPASFTPARDSDEPERRVDLDSSRDRVLEALTALPLRQKQVFLLRAVEGMDVAATATAVGVSQGSVKTHYSRALAKLRRLLEEADK
ncbi:MAG: RNA polymerase sigma factor [Gammaproteobacteria bacterium]|nr:RNA polymerase sigma factor [Gammaproteobacteria bacterium]NND59599.1 RNA polymerase sigma factor [Gammaproteobacteria bacterium]